MEGIPVASEMYDRLKGVNDGLTVKQSVKVYFFVDTNSGTPSSCFFSFILEPAEDYLAEYLSISIISRISATFSEQLACFVVKSCVWLLVIISVVILTRALSVYIYKPPLIPGYEESICCSNPMLTMEARQLYIVWELELCWRKY
jgi:hypothetical protein